MEILNGLEEDGLFVYPGEEPLIKMNWLEKMNVNFATRTFGQGQGNDLYPHLK